VGSTSLNFDHQFKKVLKFLLSFFVLNFFFFDRFHKKNWNDKLDILVKPNKFYFFFLFIFLFYLIFQKVTYPLDGLNLDKYCSNSSKTGSTYQLFSIINHIGVSGKLGHYTNYSKVGDKWFCFNDM
jgi:hypothetical protein